MQLTVTLLSDSNMYPNILRIQKLTTANQAKGAFGFTLSDCIGKWGFPAVQGSVAPLTSPRTRVSKKSSLLSSHELLEMFVCPW